MRLANRAMAIHKLGQFLLNDHIYRVGTIRAKVLEKSRNLNPGHRFGKTIA